MKFPFLFLFTSILLVTFVFTLFACAVAAELQVWAVKRVGRRRQ